MKRVNLILLFSFVILSLFGSQVVAEERIVNDPELRYGVLSNSLTYYIRHNERPKGQADFYILSNVGAIQEDDDQQGLAHFLEHMAFNGTRNFPDKDLIDYLESIGVKFGANLNASTSWDNTIYMMSDVPTLREGVVDSALLILHDWAGFIEPQEEEIDKERGVIKEELRTRDNASWRSSLAMISALARGTKYEERNLIGYLDGLNSFEPESLVRFYHDWYTPNHQAIIIVGDIDVDRVEEQIVSMFGDLPPASLDAPIKDVIRVADNQEPIVSIYIDPEMKYSVVRYFIKRDAPSIEQASTMDAMRDLIEEAFIIQMQSDRLDEVAMSADAPILGGFMTIGRVGVVPTMETISYGVQSPEGGVEQALQEIVEQMERVKRYGFTDGEFERARTNLLSRSRNAYNNRGDQLNSSFVERYMDNYRFGTAIPSAELEWQIDSMLISSATLDQVNARAKSLFTDHNHVITIDSPEKDGLDVPTVDDVLSIIYQSQKSEIAPYEDSEISDSLIPDGVELSGSEVVEVVENEEYGFVEWRLANGIEVVVKPTTLKADEVVLRGSSYGGASLLNDAQYFEGLLLSYLMSQSGVAELSAVELNRQLSGVIASMSSWVEDYSQGVSGYSSPSDLEYMLQLLYLNFTMPRFDVGDFETFKRQIRANVENQMRDPDYIAKCEFQRFAYDDNLRSRSLDLDIIDNLEFEEFANIHNQLFSDGDNFRFYIVGNVDLESLKPLVELYIGSLPVDVSSESMTYADDNIRPLLGDLKRDIEVAMLQPKVIANILITGSSLEYTLRNRVISTFVQAALDDMMLKSIREEMGGTYGVRTNLTITDIPYQNYALTLQYDTNVEQIDELQRSLYEQIEKLAVDGPTDEQMQKCREYLLKSYSNNLELNRGWLSYISALYNYDFDYLLEYANIVESITKSDVEQMVRCILDDNNRIEQLVYPAM